MRQGAAALPLFAAMIQIKYTLLQPNGQYQSLEHSLAKHSRPRLFRAILLAEFLFCCRMRKTHVLSRNSFAPDVRHFGGLLHPARRLRPPLLFCVEPWRFLESPCHSFNTARLRIALIRQMGRRHICRTGTRQKAGGALRAPPAFQVQNSRVSPSSYSSSPYSSSS